MMQPTWSDYGTRGSSAHPFLWDGCVYAAAPCLGPTGNKLFDLSGWNSFGTLTNMEPDTDWALSTDVSRSGISRRSYALNFDGSNERVVVKYGPQFALRSVSVSLWYMRTSSGTVANGRGLCGHTGASRSWLLYIPPANDGYLYFLTSNNGGYNDTQIAKYETVVANNTWHHLAGVLQAGGNARLYLDGNLVATAASTTSSLNIHTDDIEIGGYFNGLANTFFQGYLDDVMVWNRAITTEEIRLLARNRGIAYERRGYITRRYSTTTQGTGVTGTAAITLGNFTASASGGQNLGTGTSDRLASKPLSFNLSAPLSIG